MMIRTIFAVSLLAACIGFPKASDASTVSYQFAAQGGTHDTVSDTFPMFSGTNLNSVEFVYTAQDEAGFTNPGGPNPTNFLYTARVGFVTGGPLGPPQFSGLQNYSGSIECSNYCTITTSGGGTTYAVGQALSEFEGIGDIFVSYCCGTTVPAFGNFPLDSDQGNVVGTVTYTYGVPEPTTWAMMLVGMGLIGSVARRRYAGVIA